MKSLRFSLFRSNFVSLTLMSISRCSCVPFRRGFWLSVCSASKLACMLGLKSDAGRCTEDIASPLYVLLRLSWTRRDIPADGANERRNNEMHPTSIAHDCVAYICTSVDAGYGHSRPPERTPSAWAWLRRTRVQTAVPLWAAPLPTGAINVGLWAPVVAVFIR